MQRSDMEALKRDHPVEAVVAGYDIALRPSGRGLVGWCPFHDDHGRPNLYVYPETQSWYCYRCGVGGDVIDFIQRMEAVSFAEAVGRLLNTSGSPPAIPARPRVLPPVRNVELAAQAYLTEAVQVYHARLLAEPLALDYLRGRGLSHSTIERYRLGYSRGNELVPYLRRRGLPISAACRSGLLRRDREFMAGRIVIPELRAGQPVWLIGRALRCPLGAPKYLGLPGRKPLLGWEEASRSREVYLVEGPFDVLTLRQWRLPALGLAGVHAAPDALQALGRFERVYLVLDNDEAGRTATVHLLQALGKRSIPVPLSGVKDVADLAPLVDGRARFLSDVQRALHVNQHPGASPRPAGGQSTRQPSSSAHRWKECHMGYLSLNRCELIGRLGHDPALRYTPEGHAIANFSLATDRPVKPNTEAITDWHRIICWSQLAEFAGEYLSKGRLVFVAGRVTYRSYDGKDGQKRTVTEIVATEIIALDRRPQTTVDEPASEEPVS